MNKDNKANFIESYKKFLEGVIPASLKTRFGSDYISYSRINKNYTLEKVETIIESGSESEKVEMSRYFFDKGGLYQRILTYYSSIIFYNGILIPMPTNGKKVKDNGVVKKYNLVLDYLEKIELKEKLANISLRVLIDGSYFGLIQDTTKEGLIILDLPNHYCENIGKDYYGKPVLSFDLKYFNKFKNDANILEEVLIVYPEYIRQAYNFYEKRNGPSKVRIATGTGLYFSLGGTTTPSFLDIIPATMKYKNAVDIEIERDLEEIRKIIVQHIPFLSNGEMSFEPEEVEEIHKGTVKMMESNKNVSVLTTYAEVEGITSKNSNDTKANSLDKMLKNIYAESSVSGEIFSPTGVQSVSTSVQNDIAFMSILFEQYATFLTDIINLNFGNSNVYFKYNILPIGMYNLVDYTDESLKLAQSGYSLLLPSAAFGISQKQLMCLKDLENEILKLEEVLTPLGKTENTGSELGDKGGAPKKKIEDKAGTTIAGEESKNKTGE